MDQHARNSLVVENLPLVGYLAAEMCAKATHLSREDLASVGAIALISAAEAFDSKLGVPFGAYARRRIIGAFADDMRSNDWAPRGARKRITEMRTVQETLTSAIGRTPTLSELSEAMGTDQETTLAILNDSARTVVGIDDAMNDYLGSGNLTPEETMLEAEQVHIVRAAVAALPDNLRSVIERIYFQGLTVKDVAAEMSVTHSAVSQRRTAAMKLLQEGLQSIYMVDAETELEQKLTRAATQRREQYLGEFHELANGGITKHVHSREVLAATM